MEKDFWKWHSLKSNIDDRVSVPPFYEREIWWCSIGANVGAEEDGKNDPFERPVLVFRKFNKDMAYRETDGRKIWGDCACFGPPNNPLKQIPPKRRDLPVPGIRLANSLWL